MSARQFCTMALRDSRVMCTYLNDRIESSNVLYLFLNERGENIITAELSQLLFLWRKSRPFAHQTENLYKPCSVSTQRCGHHRTSFLLGGLSLSRSLLSRSVRTSESASDSSCVDENRRGESEYESCDARVPSSVGRGIILP
jgi:hypothetical protein